MRSRRIDPSRIEVMSDVVAAYLRKKTFTETAAMVFEANKWARRLFAERIRDEYPGACDEFVNTELARRWLNGDVPADNIEFVDREIVKPPA